MLQGLAADTSVIAYLMAVVGVLGILAKIINQFTLYRLVKAAGNMPKSTHRLIKLVRSKYEHACMIRDSVENIDAFVEKYIYEYRGFVFRIHTWRQIEILSVWFAGILAALGASVLYFYSGFSESVYQYIAAGIAEVVLLSVVMRLSDEPYKVNAVKMYMIDYLENICTFRLKRQSAREREFIDVISAEGSAKNTQNVEENTDYARQEAKTGRGGRSLRTGRAAKNLAEPAYAGADIPADTEPTGGTARLSAGEERLLSENDRLQAAADRNSSGNDKASGRSDRGFDRGKKAAEGNGLPINIEGEPRNTVKGEAAREAVRQASQGRTDDDRPALREEAIRQILEEFLA